MVTHDHRLNNTRANQDGTPKSGVATPLANEQMEAQRYVAGQPDTDDACSRAVVEDHTSGPATAADSRHGPSAPLVGAGGYDAFEADFSSYHQTNTDRLRGPYEHYRLVYRYGYDLGVDWRYRSATWSHVEQEARPRWEERNPGTWEQFKDMIRYAWNTARGARSLGA